MQPFGACITEISICSFWLALSLLRDVGYATMRVLMGARLMLHNARHRTMITPVNPSRLWLIHISPSYQTVYRSFEIILEWVAYCPLGWNSNPMFYANPLLQKKFNLILIKLKKCLIAGAARAPMDEPE